MQAPGEIRPKQRLLIVTATYKPPHGEMFTPPGGTGKMCGATVTLSGQRKVEYAAGDGVAIHRRERQSGNFRRAFELPAEIDLDRARASHKNGVLTLELPKSPALQPRQIEIETR